MPTQPPNITLTEPCPVCDGVHFVRLPYHYVFKGKKIHGVRCASCGLVSVHPKPAKDELKGLYSEEYFKQITAEQLVTKIVKGYRKHEWQKMRERNEALDCRVYARAAAARVGLDRFQDKHWASVAEKLGLPVRPALQPQAPKQPRPSTPAARRGRRVTGRFS